MIDNLLITVLSNALAAGILALVVALLSLRLRRASVLHVLWIAVLIRLVAPTILAIPVLPERGPSEALVQMTLALPATAIPLGHARSNAFTMTSAAVAVWLLGGLVIAVVATVRIRRMARIVDAAQPAADEIARRVTPIADRLGTAPPPLLVSEERIPPMLWAVGRRPSIVLPTDLLETLSPEQIETLIAHETAHLARRDHWVRWFEMIVTITCWWNPLAWLASRQLRRAEERSCDERVVSTFPERSRAYAESLITTLRFLSTASTSRAPAAAGMADLSEVQGRLTAIMKPKSMKQPNTATRCMLGLVFVATIVASPMLMARQGAQADLPEVFDETITLVLEDAALQDVMRTFSEVTGTPIAVSGDVDAPVTISLNDTPIREALNILARTNGLEWSIHDGALSVVAPLDDASPLLVGTHNGESVFRFKEGAFEEPLKLDGPNPQYPEECRKTKSQGLVVMDVLIDRTGQVSDLIVKKSPDNLLSEAAMEAVEQWVFSPAVKDGEPVSVRYEMTINFRLQ